MASYVAFKKNKLYSLTIVFFAGIFLLNGTVLAATLWVDGTYTGVMEDGSETSPYKKIQSAIGAAVPEDTIRVKPGVYEENVTISKQLTLIGSGPDTTVIRGAGGVTLTISANVSTTITGFTITRSSGNGIHLTQCNVTVDIVLKNIISVSNMQRGLYQAGSCTGRVLGNNCTFSNNGSSGVEANLSTVFYNSIFTNNSGYGARGYSSSNSINLIYCNFFGNSSGSTYYAATSFTTAVNPSYVDASTGDFRLQAASLCRNAGSPDLEARNPDGSRNDMGAYGGPGAAGFYDGYGSGPVVTNLHVSPGSVPLGSAINITATGKAQ